MDSQSYVLCGHKERLGTVKLSLIVLQKERAWQETRIQMLAFITGDLLNRDIRKPCPSTYRVPNYYRASDV